MNAHRRGAASVLAAAFGVEASSLARPFDVEVGRAALRAATAAASTQLHTSAVVLVVYEDARPKVLEAVGKELPPEALIEALMREPSAGPLGPQSSAFLQVPGWEGLGAGEVRFELLDAKRGIAWVWGATGHTGAENLGTTRAATNDSSVLEGDDCRDGLRAVWDVFDAGQALHVERARANAAQELAGMGVYEWHIREDVTDWSDQMFRIYGLEPGSIRPDYARFLSFVHPDDRTRVSELHMSAYSSGEPFETTERIVRADGSVRHLHTNGQVVLNGEGEPVRMHGACVDVTERVLAEASRSAVVERFSALIDASPDAILLIGNSGQILQANSGAEQIMGCNPIGRLAREVLPAALTMGGGGSWQGLELPTADGKGPLVDASAATLEGDSMTGDTAVFLHDAGLRLDGERLAAGLHEVQVRRKQALEINDNVVQGLVAASVATELGEHAAAKRYLERTLSSARQMMSDLLEPADGSPLQPGDLVRSTPALLEPAEPERSSTGLSAGSSVVGKSVKAQEAKTRVTAVVPQARPRVVVIDDSEDMRTLLSFKLQARGLCEVVGEADNGEDGLAVVRELNPDLIFLDLSMPRLDGLQALPLLVSAAPEAKIIVMSGFDQEKLAVDALNFGAHHYVEKGIALSELPAIIERVLAG